MKISTKKIKLRKPKYRRRSAEEIVEIAKGIWDHKIFTSNHLHDNERQNLGMVFLPLSMMNAVQSFFISVLPWPSSECKTNVRLVFVSGG